MTRQAYCESRPERRSGSLFAGPQVVIVRSSAGAGKTYELALRYLQLVTGEGAGTGGVPAGVANVVAITFTNKAADEMRVRIIDWMKRVILDLPFDGSGLKPIDAVTVPLPKGYPGQPSREMVMKRASSALYHILYDFFDFKVGTIDSFINVALKASAFKLNLPPDFTVSTDSTGHVEMALDEALQRILEDKRVRAVFDRFLENYLSLEGERASWLPREFLETTVSHFWKEETKENRPFAEPGSIDTLRTLDRQIAARVAALCKAIAASPGLLVNRAFTRALREFELPRGSGFRLSAYFRKTSLETVLNKGSAPAGPELEADWQAVRAGVARYVETLAALRYASYLDVYGIFRESLRREVVYRRRLVPIEDLNRLFQQIISAKSFIPEIYYALSERYLHFLIDEFQDTNELQWRNMELLVEEALSRGGTVFLVGDGKQAIYRWRGGRPKLALEVATRYRSFGVSERLLERNFRSAGAIVEFNNRVFHPDAVAGLVRGLLSPPDEGRVEEIVEIYRDSVQEVLPEKRESGCVVVERLDGGDDEGEEVEAFSSEGLYRAAGEKLPELVRSILDRGRFGEEDIAVLVRRRAEAEHVVRVLLDMGLAVDSEVTVDVRNNPVIEETINFLRFISDPDDDLAFASFLSGAIFANHSKIEGGTMTAWIADMRIGRCGEPLFGLFRRDFAALWENSFEYFFDRAGYLPLYDLLVLFLKKWGVAGAFPDDVPYLLHLLEMVAGGEEPQAPASLGGFLAFWSEASRAADSNAAEEGRSFLLRTTEGNHAVRVLTIHKAKGLQFPVVILPFLKLTTFGQADNRDKNRFFVADGEKTRLLYIKRDFRDYSPALEEVAADRETDHLLDELNNLYVALTRAEKELYVFLADRSRQKNHFIDHCFGIEGLGAFREGNRIIVGQPLSGAEQSGKGGAGPEVTVLGAGEVFGPPEKALGWMELVKTRVEPPEAISRGLLAARRNGEALHHILSLIGHLPDEPESVIDQAVAAGAGRFRLHAHCEELRDRLERLLANPRILPFFRLEEADRIWAEREIVDAAGQTFKADRVVVRPCSIDVVEFKTGEPRREAHEQQVRRYGELLAAIFPERSVKCHLCYCDEGEVITL